MNPRFVIFPCPTHYLICIMLINLKIRRQQSRICTRRTNTVIQDVNSAFSIGVKLLNYFMVAVQPTPPLPCPVYDRPFIHQRRYTERFTAASDTVSFCCYYNAAAQLIDDGMGLGGLPLSPPRRHLSYRQWMNDLSTHTTMTLIVCVRTTTRWRHSRQWFRLMLPTLRFINELLQYW